MKTFVLGDIHAGYKALTQCLGRCNFNYTKDRLIHLGDVCFLPKTNILTNNGNKYIENIKTGEFVLTHNGNSEKVEEIFKRKINEEILSIKTWKGQELLVTKNHPLFDGNKFKKANQFIVGDYLSILKKDFKIKKYIDIKKFCNVFVKEKNKILFSKSDRIKSSSIPRFLYLNKLNLRVIGYFIGDGTCRFVKKRGVVSFSIQNSGRKNKIIKNDLIDFCNNLNIKYFLIEKENLLIFHINSKILASFFREFYNTKKEKIIPDFIFNIKNSQFLHILYGLILTDGCFDKKRIRFNNTSKHLIDSIISKSYLSGLTPVLSLSRKGKYGFIINRITKQKNYYSITWRTKNNKKLFCLLNNKKKFVNEKYVTETPKYLKIKIKTIKYKKYSGYVYNLKVNKNNTYIANNIICHNCDGWTQTKECIEELMNIKNLINIIGNHDKWALEWMTAPKRIEWVTQGEHNTVSSYIPTSHIEFLRTSHLWYLEKKTNQLFVHGGIDPNKKIEIQRLDTCLWDRELLFSAKSKHNQKPNYKYGGFEDIFVGHTSTKLFKTEEPVHYCNVWGIDTGGGWAGKLTIMDIATKEFWQSDSVYTLYPDVRGR